LSSSKNSRRVEGSPREIRSVRRALPELAARAVTAGVLPAGLPLEGGLADPGVEGTRPRQWRRSGTLRPRGRSVVSPYYRATRINGREGSNNLCAFLLLRGCSQWIHRTTYTPLLKSTVRCIILVMLGSADSTKSGNLHFRAAQGVICFGVPTRDCFGSEKRPHGIHFEAVLMIGLSGRNLGSLQLCWSRVQPSGVKGNGGSEDGRCSTKNARARGAF